ncbi:hypothetical protein FKM82_007207 [Ascaphus truei]
MHKCTTANPVTDSYNQINKTLGILLQLFLFYSTVQVLAASCSDVQYRGTVVFFFFLSRLYYDCCVAVYTR